MQGSSGDLAADRRYGYARDLLKEGDAVAAADLFRQALELAPRWAPAWFGLGEACERAGDAAGAIEAYGKSLELAPDDAQGAKPRLARLGAGDPAMTPAYVAALFDEYAPRFDAHLTQALDYRGPQVILAALDACAPGRRFGAAMDLGCGTGLMGEAIRDRVAAIDGVDLSSAMVEHARLRGAYRELSVGEMVEALSRPEPFPGREGLGRVSGRRAKTNPLPTSPLQGEEKTSRYDLILAADVLVYVGDLSPLFAAAAAAMRPGALFAFTVQAQDGDPFALGTDLRFAHSSSYIRSMAATSELQILLEAPCVTRKDAGRPVPGLVVVLGRADG